jgi:hypothetical protein
MTPTKVNEFLLSLVCAVGAATEMAFDTTPRAIWAGEAIEDGSSDPYTVLRIYGGVEPGSFADTRVPVVSIQADTRGKDAQAVLAQAWKIHETFLNDDGTPVTYWAIDAKQFDENDAIVEDTDTGQWFVTVTQFRGLPGIVGRDESDRRIATDNFDVELLSAAA